MLTCTFVGCSGVSEIGALVLMLRSTYMYALPCKASEVTIMWISSY